MPKHLLPTHVHYLIDRLVAGEPITTPNSLLYDEIASQYPAIAACAQKVAEAIVRPGEGKVTQEERIYLMLHINRLAERVAEKSSK